MTVSRFVELSVLRVPAVLSPAHLSLHLQTELPALGLAGQVRLAQTDVGRQDEAPGEHEEDGEEGGEAGEEDAGQEVTLHTEQLEHQDISDQHQGSAQQDELQHADQQPGQHQQPISQIIILKTESLISPDLTAGTNQEEEIQR